MQVRHKTLLFLISVLLLRWWVNECPCELITLFLICKLNASVLSLLVISLSLIICGFRQLSNPFVEIFFISFSCFLWNGLCLVVQKTNLAKETEPEMFGCLPYFSFFTECHSSIALLNVAILLA